MARDLKKALEPFLRAYRVSLEPFAYLPDSTGLREVIPGVWPTAGDLRALFEAAIAADLDYEHEESRPTLEED